jgi:hypothetical protein
MKISVNDVELFQLNETQKKVIKNDILEEEFENDMKRRLQYILMHKYERCFERLKNEWTHSSAGEPSKLEKNGVQSIPTNPDALAELIFSQPNYKNRTNREKEKQKN